MIDPTLPMSSEPKRTTSEYIAAAEHVIRSLEGAIRLLRSGPAVGAESQAWCRNYVDRCLDAHYEHDPVREERMGLLEQIDSYSSHVERLRVLHALARKTLGIAAEEADEPLLRASTEAILRAKTEWFEHEMAAHAASLLQMRPPSLEQFFERLTQGSPAVARRARLLTQQDIELAVEIWPRTGRPRKSRADPEKWPFLASLMEKMGIGGIAPDSLRADWQAWKREHQESDD